MIKCSCSQCNSLAVSKSVDSLDLTDAPKSDAEHVREFTEGAGAMKCPTQPQPMNKAEVTFVIKMVLSELVELAQTVTETDTEAIELVESSVKTDLSQHERTTNPDELAAHQGDAAVDAMYYMYNCFAKKGINLSKMFQVVHQANMNKRDPTTGKFIRRESDGKVLKPPGWQAPDVLAEILRQKQQGSWSH
jgi:predicted HAD superfamily Cof-like phosphohydrolase